MSIKVMTRVWEHAEYKESTLLILLALADFADDNGLCWPEVPTLAAKARVSDRRATDIIQTLEKDGAIVYKRGGGRGRRSLYGVLIGLTDEQKERVKLFHRNYFTENKTVKPSVIKGELQRKERVNYSVNSRKGLGQQEAPNPDPIRHVDPSLDPSVGERGKKQAVSPTHPPAVRAYFETYPNQTLDADQIDLIASTVTDLNRWREVLKYWKASSYRAQSIPKMLDRYSSGASIADERPGGNRQQSNGRLPADLPMITAGADQKKVATLADRQRIIEASNAKARGE